MRNLRAGFVVIVFLIGLLVAMSLPMLSHGAGLVYYPSSFQLDNVNRSGWQPGNYTPAPEEQNYGECLGYAHANTLEIQYSFNQKQPNFDLDIANDSSIYSPIALKYPNKKSAGCNCLSTGYASVNDWESKSIDDITNNQLKSLIYNEGPILIYADHSKTGSGYSPPHNGSV